MWDFSPEVGLGVGSWPSNRTNAGSPLRLQVNLIIFRDLTQEYRINL